MREHPVIGERILATVPGLESVARAVRHEHERWDGDGYPDGLVGDAIPLASRIVLACDAWHALNSDRPYRRALPRDVALDELRRCAGTQFDPTVTAALLDVLETAEAGDEASGRPDPGAIVADVVGGNASLERELVALIAVASAVAAAHKLEEVIEIAAEEALGAIGAASLSIERWIADRGILRTLVNVGDLAPGEERHPVDEMYQLEGDRDLRRVLEDGGTYFCSLDDPEIAPIEADLLRGLGKHSSVAVPITFGGETWGQIWAARRADQPPFSERDARFLHAISGQVGSAIGRAEVFSRVSELAHSDGLTGLANRRAFDEALELAVLEARRTGHDLALLLCDMDNLKDINDHHGHEAGDAALRTVADALTQVGRGGPGRARLPRRRRRVRDRPAPLRRPARPRGRREHPAPAAQLAPARRRLLRRRDAARRARAVPPTCCARPTPPSTPPSAAGAGACSSPARAAPSRPPRAPRRPPVAAARCATRRCWTSAGCSRRSSACSTARSPARRRPSASAACCAASARRPTPSAGPSPSPRWAASPSRSSSAVVPGNVTAMARARRLARRPRPAARCGWRPRARAPAASSSTAPTRSSPACCASA